MKIVAFSDVHYFAGDIKNAIFNTKRKLVRYSLPMLDCLTEKINEEYRAQLVVNLGDIIQDTTEHDGDIEALKFVYKRLGNIKCRCCSVLGNHDLKMMDSVGEVEDAVGIKSTLSFDLDGWHLVFLSTEVRPELGTGRGGCYKAQYLADDTLRWLREDLDKNKLPTLIFTHFALAEDDSVNDECMFMKNRGEVKDIIESSGKVRAVFSGHQHKSAVIVENEVTYYVVNSMIANTDEEDRPSGEYLLIELEGEKMTVTAHHISVDDVSAYMSEEKMNVKGAIFDMDGTLVDSLGFWDYIWRRLGEIFISDPLFRPDPVTEKGVRTSTLYDAAALVHNNCGIGKSVDEVFEVVDRELADYYRNVVELKKGAREFLEHLYEKGVKMCVATATAPHLLSILMEKFGLKKYFGKLVSCNDVGKGKEHPDVFIAAHEYLGTSKESTWIFEDSIVAIETATKAGYNTVGVYDQFNFGIGRVKELSSIYIGEGDSLISLIDKI